MNILLINPATQRYTRTVCTPLGLLSIATYLDKNGHTVKLLNRTVVSTDIDAELNNFKPTIIGVSVYSVKSFSDAILVSNAAKAKGITVVWGGPFVSSLPEKALDLGCVDIISVGEGEATWLELANTIAQKADINNVRGIVYAKNGGYIRTQDREFMDLADLPPIDFSFTDVKPLLHTEYNFNGVFGLYMSKGCICSCTFCYNSDFHKNTYRRRPVEHFMQEARELVEKYGMKAVSFTDELFCKNKSEMYELCSAIKESKLGFVWGCMTRIDIFEKKDFDYMYECGCRWIEFGVESGSPDILKQIKKCISPDKVVEAFSACSEAGIIALAYFIVGFPGETEDDLKLTVQLAQRMKMARSVFSYYNPLPGSELYGELLRKGKVHPLNKLTDYANSKAIYSPCPNLSEIPTKDLKVVRSHFLWESFSKRTFAKENNKYSVAKKDIEDIFENMRGHGFKAGVELFFASAHEFLDIFFYANFFPKIKKKYGIK